MAKKKIYRTVIHFEVLSDEPNATEGKSLEAIGYETTKGDLSGCFLDSEIVDEELTEKKAVDAIIGQGSDPEFFGIDENGNEIEEDDENEEGLF